MMPSLVIPYHFTESLRSVALKGYFGYSNIGDDALLCAGLEIAQQLWRMNQLLIIGQPARYLSWMAPGLPIVPATVPIRPRPDLTVYCGGTQFFSFSPRAAQASARGPLDGGSLAEGMRFWVKRLATKAAYQVGWTRTRRRSFAAIGIGIGPFTSGNAAEARARRLLRSMTFVSVRDPVSYELCRKWGLSRVVLQSDLCYLPGLWSAHLEENSRSAIRRVGIIVRDWPYSAEGAAHLLAAQRVAATLRMHGTQVRFILFTAFGDPRCRERLRADGEDVVVWDPENQTVSHFLAALKQCDALVTSRFHGAVFGSLLRIPTVCIEVEPKLSVACQVLGDGTRLWPFPYEPKECLRALQEFDQRYRVAVDAMDAAVREQRQLAEHGVAQFTEMYRRINQSVTATA